MIVQDVCRQVSTDNKVNVLNIRDYARNILKVNNELVIRVITFTNSTKIKWLLQSFIKGNVQRKVMCVKNNAMKILPG